MRIKLIFMKNLVVLTGAGISQESGIKTFRGGNGLWDEHKIEDVADIRGWNKNPELVLDFYNKRRKELEKVEPNQAHKILVELEQYFNVYVITTNVDNLHERAGSKNVLHIHGELTKVRGVSNNQYIKDIGYTTINIGDTCPKGSQLRPHIVWFGEDVPKLHDAIVTTRKSDIFVIIGTSLQVYPAASLLEYIQPLVPVYMIDPNPTKSPYIMDINYIEDKAVKGTELLSTILKTKI